MRLKELTFEELVEIKGGSEASNSLFYWLGYGTHKFWTLITTSSDNSYSLAKVGY
jgi:hypothetical protein